MTAWWLRRHDGQLSLGPLTTCILPLQLLLQGSLRQEEVKQPHYQDAQRPSIIHTRLIYFLKKNLFIGDSFVQFPSSYTCKTCGNVFWRGESLPRHQITCHFPFCPACRPSATTAARTSQETPGSLSTCWRSMKLAAPFKILHERYMATLIKHRRISFAICYITFKTNFSFKEHWKSGAHLLHIGITTEHFELFELLNKFEFNLYQ